MSDPTPSAAAAEPRPAAAAAGSAEGAAGGDDGGAGAGGAGGGAGSPGIGAAGGGTDGGGDGGGGDGGGGDGGGAGGGDGGDDTGDTGDDDPGGSTARLVEKLGVPVGEFAGILDTVIADATSPARDAHASAWVPLGPRNVGGAIRALVQDANQPSRFFAGSAQGGLWRTDDEGLTWKPMGGLHQAFPVGALALAPHDSRILYVGTGEPFQDRSQFGGQGLFVSTDGGETLTRIARAAAGAHAAPGAADHYARIRADPAPTEAAGEGRITSAGTAVSGGAGADATLFTVFFAAGDVLRAGGELRVVTAVTSDTVLAVDRPFPADLAAPTPYFRATPRIWIASETGLRRFEPGKGFVNAGVPVPAGAAPRITDVVLAEDPAAPATVVLFAALAGRRAGNAAQAGGIFRGVFTRATLNTAWTAAVLRRPTGAAPRPPLAAGSFGRIKLTMTVAPPFAVYAVLEDLGAVGSGPRGHPSHVYASDLTGAVWTSRARMYTPAGAEGSAWYAMTLEVHPRDRNRLIGGAVDLFTSSNGGTSWAPVLDWRQFDRSGERGQHADQHAVVFDVRDLGNPFASQRVWIANDGGVSSTERVVTVSPFRGWRKRSYGIVVSQFNAIDTHPRYPFVTGGGMQDTGSYVSYGGPTWYYVDGGDGGALAWNPDAAGTAPRVFYTSWQRGIDKITVGAAATLPGSSSLRTTLPDVAPPGNVMRAQAEARALPTAPSGLFIEVLVGHPTTADNLLVGLRGGARRSINGTAFPALPTPAFVPPAAEVSAASYVPAQASDHVWLGTTGGQVFRTDNATLFTNVSPPWTAATPPRVGRLAMAASGANYRVAVASVGRAGELFIADVSGAAVNWRRLTGLPATPLLALAFDPTDPTTLFVGTLAGVYGAVDLPVFGVPAGPPIAPTWQAYKAGLPLTLVSDLEVVPVTGTLRCATYGRGVFERELASTPAAFKLRKVALLIRNHVIDDGRAYPAANTFASDPRLGAAVALDDVHSFDIRADAPLFRAFEVARFGEPLDGGEFDETLVHDHPIAGEVNVVYVQVQNRGNQAARNAEVHLFFAAAAGPAAGPDLQAGFRAAFRGNLPAGAWQRAAPVVTIGEIGPGQPAVARFEWMPPFDLGANAALLAITTQDPDDPLDLGGMAAANDAVLDLVRNERRAALRITPVVTNPIYLRDGVDDDGSPGAVAWGGRSPDIVVLAAAPPADVNTNPAFTDLDDPRLGDRVRAGANRVIVRVHNRSDSAVAANVDLYRVPLDALGDLAAWTRGVLDSAAARNAWNASNRITAAGGVSTPAIPARSWRFTAPVTWTVADAATSFVLVAVASPVVAGGPPKPDPAADVQSLEALWRFVRSGALSDKVAMRALRRA
jgi:hypothetical protein